MSNLKYNLPVIVLPRYSLMFRERTLIRITIQDARQTISFLSDEDIFLRLIAGCSSNPGNLGELLIATEIYHRGITSRLMGDLMEFDKAVRQKGPDFIHKEISIAREKKVPLEWTFQAIDKETEREAIHPRACELAVIDLTSHNIQTSQGLEVPTSSEIRIHSGVTSTNPVVTYILPQDWTIRHFRGRGK